MGYIRNKFQVIDRRVSTTFTAMSTTKDTKPNASEAQDAQKPEGAEKPSIPSLGALDEDDEFEEFETEGASRRTTDSADWPDSETVPNSAQNSGFAPTDGASVALDMSGSARSGGDHLWEDNWDDDDIEDDFSNALRYVHMRRATWATWLRMCARSATVQD